ncbi:alpha/beta hydrolase [Pseudoduganella sp. OTU4001]|uniref:alpha/beta hydrolase n=1 Tax=Pseudoduganella sp. OTU4001 TaxID=3043854 RepID=UPI00313D9787
MMRLLALAPLFAASLACAAPVESVVDAAGPLGPLKGTLLAPATPAGPVALIIPGSGPTDQNGNNPLGVRASTYMLLAQELAARGVATIRIDKRGMFASAAATKDANAVTIADYVTDIRAWTDSARKHTSAKCVWLIGHSEGGLVAMAAAREVPSICGLVLVAAAGRPLGTVLRDQLKANPANAPLLEQAMGAIDALEQGRRVDTAGMHPALLGLFAPQVQGFLASAFSYDPARLLAGYRQPVLILQGQRDIQISERDGALLKQAAPHATLVMLPDVNHVLKAVPSSDRRQNLATYAEPGIPLAPGVSKAIADFIVPTAP